MNRSLQQSTNSDKSAFFDRKDFARKDFEGRRFDPYHRHGRRFFGPIFWPYFFDDFFSYAFWPYDYEDEFWGYDPEAILSSSFWPYQDFVYNEAGGDRIGQPNGARITAAEACTGFAPGVTDLSIQQLRKIADASADQREALNDLEAAIAKASEILKRSCRSQTLLTPLARLDAMQHRLQAIEEASEVIKGPLERFYGLLTDAQKRRLEESNPSGRQHRAGRAHALNLEALCAGRGGVLNLPAEKIAKVIKLGEEQKQELENLKFASAQAVAGLKASCPSRVPDTMEGRLDSVQKRVKALIEAINAVRPALEAFYGSLMDEQKAALVIQPAPQIAKSQ